MTDKEQIQTQLNNDNKNVILYTIKDCPKCKNLKNRLFSKEISFDLIEMSEEEIGFLMEKGFKSAPVLSVNNNQMLDYKNALKWVAEV